MPTVVIVVAAVALVVLIYVLVRWLPAAPPSEPIVPREPLFSMPTLSSVTPETEPSPDDAEAHRIDQDDYLQVEFVVDRDRDSVNALLTEIERSAETNRAGDGYARVVVRPAPRTQLRSLEIRREVVESVFPDAGRGKRALFVGARGGTHSSVVGGFAFEVPGLGVLNGTTDAEGFVTSLGIDRLEREPTMAALTVLHAFASRTGLAVVDWVGRRWL